MNAIGHPLNVVGLVIQTAPGKVEAVRASLAMMPGVDVHATGEDGRIIATAIDTGDSLAIDQMAAMNRTPGIVSTMLAYHQIDDPAAAADCGCADLPNHSCHSHTGA
ncbi:MAG: chaperone NapD [Proteobacteria bacterium]|nr:chaperone NapD [Pseudomonadota bacterium]